MNRLGLVLPVLVTLSAINVAYLVWFDTYDFWIGPLHMVAHGYFKPLLILGTTFYLAILTRKPAAEGVGNQSLSAIAFWIALAALSIHWFAITSPLNALFDEWNYREYSSQIHVPELFTRAQIGAWYRPLGFLSLWIDSKIFGDQLWGYHVQNVAFHLVNAYLVLLFARRIGIGELAGQWGAFLYIGASSAYEAVMWPSARFDLMAMTFTGLALIWSIDYLRQGRGLLLGGAWVAYALALFSKESGYALPVLLLPLVWQNRSELGRAVRLLGAIGAVTAVMLAIRFAALHGVGGYPEHPGVGSPHLSFSRTTLVAILTRTFPISLIAVKQLAPITTIARAATSLFALMLAAAVWSGASTTVKQRWIALYALIATIPVATLISWLDPRAQHVRYVYMPAFFIMLLTACALTNVRYRWIAGVFLLLGLECGVHNINVYKSTYARGDEMAAQISRDADGSPGITKAVVYGMPPDEFNGVLFSIFQVQYRLAQLRPGMTMTVSDQAAESNAAPDGCGQMLCYAWNADAREIHRLEP